MLIKIWVNGVLHIIPDVISIELYEETSEDEGYISVLYITSLEFKKHSAEKVIRFNYDDVEHMTVKKVK